MVVFAKTFDNHHRKLNFGDFFNSPLKPEKDLNQTFWLTPCHGFTQGYLHFSFLKALYKFKFKIAHEA